MKFISRKSAKTKTPNTTIYHNPLDLTGIQKTLPTTIAEHKFSSSEYRTFTISWELKKKFKKAVHQWLIPVILPTREADSGGP
jgi:hypothetical protein